MLVYVLQSQKILEPLVQRSISTVLHSKPPFYVSLSKAMISQSRVFRFLMNVTTPLHVSLLQLYELSVPILPFLIEDTVSSSTQSLAYSSHPYSYYQSDSLAPVL